MNEPSVPLMDDQPHDEPIASAVSLAHAVGFDVEIRSQPGRGVAGLDSHVFACPSDVMADPAALRRLVVAASAIPASAIPASVVALAAAPLSRVPPGASVRSMSERAASEARERPVLTVSSAPVALLRPGTAFEIGPGLVTWEGTGIEIPGAVVATADTQYMQGEATPASRPVLRRGTVVCAASVGRLHPQLRAWVEQHATDPALVLQAVSADAPPIAGLAPAASLPSLVTLRPDVVLVHAGDDLVPYEEAIGDLPRTVVVQLAEGTGFDVPPPRGRVRGRLGVDAPREVVLAGLARVASGPSARDPRIRPIETPPGQHVRHTDPPPGRPARRLGLLAFGANGFDARTSVLAAACLGAANLEVIRSVPDLPDPLDALIVPAPAVVSVDVIERALSGRIGVMVDLYGDPLMEDPFASLPPPARRSVLPLVPTGAARLHLQEAFGLGAQVLPPTVPEGLPVPRESASILVVASATADPSDVTQVLAAASAADAGPVRHVGTGVSDFWVGAAPAPAQLVADATVVVVVGTRILDAATLDTIARAGLSGRVLLVDAQGAISDLVGSRGVIEVSDGMWTDGIAGALALVDQPGRQPGAWARACMGDVATRARLLRLTRLAQDMAA